MSDPQNIEQFNIENPPNLFKRGSGFSTNNDITDEEIESNDNIIFEKEVSSIDLGIKSKNGLKKAYCGIRGDSEISGILNIVVSAIGGGCFNLPYIMYDGGIIVSLIIFLFVTICIVYSLDLLRSFVVDTKYFSFALMTETILGPKWLKLYAVSSFIIYVSMEVSYLSSIYVYIQGIFNITDVWFTILYFFISMIIEIIICIYISKNAKMHLLSLASISCFFILFISLISISIAANIKGEVESKFTSKNLFFPGINPDTFFNRLLKIASYLMEYVYSYSYHSTFPTLIGNLSNVTHSSTQKVHLISFGIVFGAYFLTTIFGFIMCNKVPVEIFKQDDNNQYFTGEWEYLIIPFKIVLCIYLLTLVPIRFIVVRDNYITLFGEKKVTFFQELIIITIFIFICNIFVFGVGIFEILSDTDMNINIKSMIQAFGGIFGVIISFCLPVINYISVNGKKKIKSFIGYAIFIFYVIVGFFSTVHSIHLLIFGNKKEEDS